jgi:hypothetical protein
MPDTIPDWAASPAPDWATSAVPDWATPAPAKISAPPAADPNAPGGFNYAGKVTKIVPDTPLGEDFAGDLLQNASRPAVALPRFTVQPDDSRMVAGAKSAANLVIGLPEFLESPLGIASAGAATVAAPAVAAGFLAQTGKDVVSGAGEAGKHWDELTPAQRTETLVNLGGETLLAAAMAHGTGAPAKVSELAAPQAHAVSRLADLLQRGEIAPLPKPPEWASARTGLVEPGVAAPPKDLVTVPGWARPADNLPPPPEVIPNSKPSAPQAEPALAAPPTPAAVAPRPNAQTPPPTVPEPAATLAAQVEATRDPQNPKAVTLVTHGEDVPAGHGLTEVETPQGVALVNPAKVDPATAKTLLDADQGGRLLGMSTPAKPAGDVVVQTKTADGTPVQEEIASPATLPQAIAAGKKVAPGGTVEIKPPAQVIAERQEARRWEPLPVDVSEKEIAAMRDATERPPDVIDDVQNHYSGPVKFKPAQFGTVVADARQRTFTAGGKPSAATKRFDSLISDANGAPADEVLKGLAEENPKYADWTEDDLAQAIVDAHQRRESPAGDPAQARQLAEEQKRTQLWEAAAFKPRQPMMPNGWPKVRKGDFVIVDGVKRKVEGTSNRGEVSVENPETKMHDLVSPEKWSYLDGSKFTKGGTEPIAPESLFMGDEVTVDGKPMRVVDMPVDAETGRPYGVTLEGAYGRQTVPAGQTLHIDRGSLKAGAPELIGMGGAIAKEFENSAGTATGIKVAAIDAQRAARGLEPLSKTASRSFSNETWQQTLAHVDDNPEAPAALVNDLKRRQDAGEPTPLSDRDVALLLYREADLSYQRAKLSRDMAQAEDDARLFPNRADELPAMKLERARIADELDKLENVIGPARSETGRGLAALRHMVLDNYTLAAMEFSRKAAKGGDPLTDAERAELGQLRERIEQATKELETARNREAEDRSKRLADEEIAQRIAEIEKTPGYDRHAQSLAERIVAAISKEADAARERMRERMKRLNAGVDPTMLSDLAIIGAEHIAKGTLDFTRWSKAMVDEFGEKIVPWLNQAWAKANDRVDTAVDRLAKGKQSIEVKQRVRKDDLTGQRANIIAGLKSAVAEQRPLDEVGNWIRQLMENHIRNGLREREPLVDAIHKTLTEEAGFKDATRREVREAMSNYGKFKALNPDEIKAKRRDISHQIAQTLKLEDITARKPLPKSGVEQHTPSTEGRLLEQQVNEAKRRYGVVVTDPARQLKGALDARKTALRNRIADLEFQIAAGQRTVKTKTATPYDAETKLLEVRRDELKRQLEEIAPRPQLTDAQRLVASERAIERENALLEEQIKTGEVTLRSSRPAMSSARLDALKARRAALLAEREELRAVNPEYQADLQARQTKALLARLAAQAADYAERTARGDFAPRPVREAAWKQSPEVLAAMAKREAAKADFQRGNELARRARQTNFERGLEGLAKWKRTFVLSWPSTLAKLSSAAVEGIALTPLEELAGTPFAKAFGGIAERAPRHTGFNLRAEVAAITDTVTHLVKNMKDAQTTGQTQIDLVHGKPVIVPRELKDWVGNFHYALKTPLFQNEFSRSFSKLMQAEAARGVDVMEPLVQQRIGNQAYILAKKAIFKEDNLVVKMYHRALSATRDQVDGRQTRTGKLAETALRVTFPVVDIPTTIVKRTFEYLFGLPLGLGRAAAAYRAGLENLKSDEAEAILRNLKRGSLGGAVLLLGFFNPQNFGGYYQPHEKRDAKDVKAGGVRLFGRDVPRYLVHNPLLEQLQIGATMRRVADAQLHGQPNGLAAGAWAGLLGLVDEVPFMQGTKRMVSEPTPTKLLGEQALSLVPGAVQSVAQHFDTDKNGETISRKPTTILQTIETGIPGLRQTVPARVTTDVQPLVDAMSRKYIPRGVDPATRAALRAAFAENLKTNAVAK